MKLKEKKKTEGYRQLNVFDHFINQKLHSFKTFSELLEAL